MHHDFVMTKYIIPVIDVICDEVKEYIREENKLIDNNNFTNLYYFFNINYFKLVCLNL